jgi:hypothetical protein
MSSSTVLVNSRRGLGSASVASWTVARPGLTECCTERRDLWPVLAIMTSAETSASPRWVAELVQMHLDGQPVPWPPTA